MSAPTQQHLLGLVVQKIKPPPRLSTSEFAEQERVLSVESSARSGRWRNIRYQVEIQDTFGNEKTVVLMTAAQVGKTEILKNMLLRAMVYETGGTTLMLPSESVAIDYSKA